MPHDVLSWAASFAAETRGKPASYVRLVIISRETRIPAALRAFLGNVVNAMDARVGKGEADGPAAVGALDDALAAMGAAPATFAWQLPIGTPFRRDCATHVTHGDLVRFGLVDVGSPAPDKLTLSLGRLLPAWKTAIWMTPDDCGTDPDTVARDLGLPHFDGEIPYRYQLDVVGVDQYAPSCLDARLFEAWQEPPPAHLGPCGRTRHLENGRRVHDEFLIRAADVVGRTVALVRLPPGGPITHIGPLAPDYLVSR